MTLRITSWNVNSVRIRCGLLKRFCDEYAPDILCLQETKVENHLFPCDDLKSLGYDYLYFNGQKSYHGVAILSKIPLKEARSDRFIDNDEKRHLCALLPDGTELHNFYVPAGGDIPDPIINLKFRDKLNFVDAMARWSGEQVPADKKAIILGDFNIAPHENDVWSHKQLLSIVSHTPVETEKLSSVKAASQWIDVLRDQAEDSEKLYSWWSYRNRDWAASNRGRRLDHIWVTPALKSALKSGFITRDARGWETPSDHVPVTIDLEGVG